jgi:predicted DNA-binding transcriptional regulator YafY
VLHAEPCEERFARPDGFDSLAYVVRSLANAPGTWSVEVLLKTTFDQARQHVPSAMATLEPDSGGVALRCHIENLDWIARFLVGLGFPLVVRRPDELRDALRRLAAEISATAEPPNDER